MTYIDGSYSTRPDSISYIPKTLNGGTLSHSSSTNVASNGGRVSGFEICKDQLLEHQRQVCTNGRFASGMKTYTDEHGNKITKWFDQNKKVISESVVKGDIMTTTYYRADGTKNSEITISDNYPFFRGSKQFDENGNILHSSGTRKLDLKM